MQRRNRVNALIVLSFLGIGMLLSCCDKQQHPPYKLTASQTPKQETHLREEVDWRSIQTIDAHDEQDTIVGNFTGKSIDCLIREKVVTFRMVKLNLLLSIFCITK